MCVGVLCLFQINVCWAQQSFELSKDSVFEDEYFGTCGWDDQVHDRCPTDSVRMINFENDSLVIDTLCFSIDPRFYRIDKNDTISPIFAVAFISEHKDTLTQQYLQTQFEFDSYISMDRCVFNFTGLVMKNYDPRVGILRTKLAIPPKDSIVLKRFDISICYACPVALSKRSAEAQKATIAILLKTHAGIDTLHLTGYLDIVYTLHTIEQRFSADASACGDEQGGPVFTLDGKKGFTYPAIPANKNALAKARGIFVIPNNGIPGLHTFMRRPE
jgi:hypothetical protein